MIVYIVIAKVLPDLMKKPTGISFIDDINSMLISQKGSIGSGALLTGIVVLITNYIYEEFS
jgi:hypothetical protein